MDESLLNIMWILVSAGLVFLMQAGFMCLESGLTRPKNSINVAVKNLADFVFSICGFWALGYGIMFGAGPGGWFGTTGFFPSFEASDYQAAFFLFQAMFCGTATTIFSGAVAERMRFSSYIIVAGILAVAIYPVFGHWAWNGLDTGQALGRLGALGFIDFAGSTVVHSVGGWVALAALLVIGPRTGRFPEDGPPREINAGNLPLSVLGAMLLWFGWFGFNGGSTLAMNADVPSIIVNTTLAGSAGGVACLLLGWRITRIPKVTYLINGSLGGLVAITANCHVVGALDSVVIGALAGPVCLGAEELLLKLRIDDAVGAVPVHLACGIWGTLAVALFGDPERIGTGLGFAAQFGVQLLGVGAAFVVAFVLPLLILMVIDKIRPMRVTEDEEHLGLNVSEHGARTDIIDLFQAMDRLEETRDISIRLPEEPFSEVGLIARRYNQALDSLQQALSKTEAVFRCASDAIITFSRDTLTVDQANPTAALMFDAPDGSLAGKSVEEFLRPLPTDTLPLRRTLLDGGHVELTGQKSNGALFPMEAAVTNAGVGDQGFMVGIFRDITGRRKAEESLRKAEADFRSIFENAVEGIFRTTPDGRYLMANPALAHTYGFDTADEMIVHFENIADQLYVEAERRDDFIRLMETHGEVRGFESRIRRKGGSIIWITENAREVRDGRGELLYYEGTVQDVTRRKMAEEALAEQQAYFTQLFESSPQGIVLIDTMGRVVDVNKGFEDLFGLKADQIRGLLNRSVIVPDDLLTEAEAFHRAVFSGKHIQKETLRKHKDGRHIPVAVTGYPIHVNGNIAGVYYIYADISERKEFERQLTHQAFHDALTGLPNRVLFSERLNRAVKRAARREDYAFATLMLDLDRFKWINDSLGHLAGDRFLKEISSRLSRCIRAVDTVARLGGDEFGILLEEYVNPREVVTVAKRIQAVLEEPMDLSGTEVRSSGSIGIVIRTGDYQNAEDIIRDADIAMYRAKESGRARFKVFNQKMHVQVVKEIEMDASLRAALANGDLCLYYQPIVTVPGRKLNGFEALVRWHCMIKGMIQPSEFIPLAEETGLIVPLGLWVLEKACERMADWCERYPQLRGMTMSVNISCKQFMQPDLAESIIKILENTGLPAQNLKLEITESSVMRDAKSAVTTLLKLKRIGVRLVIDDFGTGYSSLSHLQSFPIDGLKIDRSFISGENAESNPEIVRTIVAMAHNMGMDVVAEGVEQESQFDLLARTTCQSAQGFMFSRPVNEERAEELINELLANE